MKKTIHDWSRLDAMTDAERNAAAMNDPDAKPLTPEDFKRMKRTPQVKVIRRASCVCDGVIFGGRPICWPRNLARAFADLPTWWIRRSWRGVKGFGHGGGIAPDHD